MRFAFAFEIGDLAGDQFLAPGGDGNFADDFAQVVARPAFALRRDFEGDRQQRVAREHRDAFAENLVASRRGRGGNRRYPCSGDRRG